MSDLINWNHPTQKISRFFTVGEVTQAKVNRIPKSPEVIKRILTLSKHLDLVRSSKG